MKKAFLMVLFIKTRCGIGMVCENVSGILRKHLSLLLRATHLVLLVVHVSGAQRSHLTYNLHVLPSHKQTNFHKLFHKSILEFDERG